MEHQQLTCLQRESRIGSAFIVHKLHFKHPRSKHFHDGPHLATAQTTVRNVFRQCYDVQGTDFWVHDNPPSSENIAGGESREILAHTKDPQTAYDGCAAGSPS